ncbi:MAG: selenocysteine-specific translation elongation factor [Dehalococcoidales bacterium]
MFVLGTAGHIDHGKSVLVKALTGIDPDRLQEEKERGMTIDLGFAWFRLPGGEEVGIVDVPGHERFIKNMLAGVGGIDLALLIVAANEGVMPQTREHLAILDLLGIEKGIVAVTKKDLVDEEWLELVTLDIEEAVNATSLSGAPIVAVSALTGEGLPDLVAAIDELLGSTPLRKDTGRPRLPIDRIFTIAGAGTVVTGTLMDSSLSTGREVEIVPQGLKSRIRGLQTHKTRVDTAGPGNRVAVNLVGIATTQIKRGDVLTTPGWLVPTNMVSVRLRLLPHLRRPLAHNTTVSFHTGAAETMARVRLLENDKLAAGETAWAQLSLKNRVALLKGDHFIIRSPNDTLGGGTIVDPHTKRLRRHRPDVIEGLNIKQEGSAEDILLSFLETRQPAELSTVLRQSDLPSEKVSPAIDSLLSDGRITVLGQGEQKLLYSAPGWAQLTNQVMSALKGYHGEHPARPGMPRADLASRLNLGKHSQPVFQKLAEDNIIAEEGAAVRLADHQVAFTPAQQNSIDSFLKSLAAHPHSPPSNLIPEADLLNLLISRKQVVKVSDGVVFSTEAYDDMVGKLTAHIKSHDKVTLAEVRDIFETSRKYAQALLEHLDEKKITRRVGDDRVLY